MPMISTTTARIKIESVGGSFFDISDENFTIGNSNLKAWFKADTKSISTPFSATGGIQTDYLNRVLHWYDENSVAGLAGYGFGYGATPPILQQDVIGGKPAIYFEPNHVEYLFGHTVNFSTDYLPDAKTVMVVGKMSCNAAPFILRLLQ